MKLLVYTLIIHKICWEFLGLSLSQNLTLITWPLFTITNAPFSTSKCRNYARSVWVQPWFLLGSAAIFCNYPNRASMVHILGPIRWQVGLSWTNRHWDRSQVWCLRCWPRISFYRWEADFNLPAAWGPHQSELHKCWITGQHGVVQQFIDCLFA